MSDVSYVTADQVLAIAAGTTNALFQGAIRRAAELPDRDPDRAWLIDQIWSAAGVGVIGAPPKAFKTWLVAETAVSVATGTPFLETYAVRERGAALCFFAEDAATEVKARLRALCHRRKVALQDLDVFVIARSQLLLDDIRDFRWLEDQVKTYRPRLLVLDPLVRVFRGDEDDAGSISRVLGALRKVQREYGVAVMLVHHVRKNARTTTGASLRGSGDLHAWGDSNIYLTRQTKGSRVVVEHRAARAPAPFCLRLSAEGGPGTEYLVRDDDAGEEEEKVEASIEDEVLTLLENASGPLGHGEVRDALGKQGQRVADALRDLAASGRIEKDGRAWRLRSVPESPP